MKSVALVVKPGISRPEILPMLKEEGFSVVEKNPDFVLAVGGDGTFLVAERFYPGIPKTIIKESKIGNRCHNLPLQTILHFIKNNQFTITEQYKLEVTTDKTKLVAANDVVLRNKKQINALRFSLTLNNEVIAEEIIGDGIIIATPFGSTGYFHSITQTQFEKGFGLGFNNPTKHIPPQYLSEDDIVIIKLLRTDGLLSVDNNPKIITIAEGKEIIIKKSQEKFRLFSFKV